MCWLFPRIHLEIYREAYYIACDHGERKMKKELHKIKNCPIRLGWEEKSLPLIGKMGVIVNDKGVCAIYFGNHPEKREAIVRHMRGVVSDISLSNGLFRHSRVWEGLIAYARGACRKVDVPLAPLTGTPFERSVWETLGKIPYGRLVSYSWVARESGHAKAVRAVANAIGKNPLPILLPCHRVIRKNGALGGFSSGLEMKKTLLKIEKAEKAVFPFKETACRP